MYHKIIVPLDGSPLAEKALPYATKLAKQLKATLVLLRVEEAQPLVVEFSESPQVQAGNLIHAGKLRPDGPMVSGPDLVPAYSSDPYQTFTSYSGKQDDEDYLQKVKETLMGVGAETPLEAEQIQTLVVCGRSSKELAAIVTEAQADLVVMTTHGRSGLSLLLTGSVATNLIQHSSLPVILIKLDETEGQSLEKAEKPVIHNNSGPILVTLDGTAGSETILEAAANLAQQLGVKLHLFEVVSSVIPGGLGDAYCPPEYDPTREIAALQEQAEQYLKEIQIRLGERGVECLTVVQTGEPTIPLEYKGEPITRVIAYAKEVKAQLVAMTTHGRGRIGQLVLGSVAEEVVRQSHLSVMLIRKTGHANHLVEN